MNDKATQVHLDKLETLVQELDQRIRSLEKLAEQIILKERDPYIVLRETAKVDDRFVPAQLRPATPNKKANR